MQEMQETSVQSQGQDNPLEEERQLTLVSLSGKSHGQRSLVGYSPWGCKESDMTEQLSMHIGGFEKFKHFPGNLEGHMHVEGCVHTQERSDKLLSS